MRFLQKTLQSDERPVCRSRLHGIYLVVGLAWFAGLSAIGWISDYQLWSRFGAYMPQYEINNEYLHFGLAPGWIGWAFTAGGGVILFSEIIKLISTHVVLTTKRLIYKTGFLRVKMSATDVGDILGAHVDQGWFGQFLGYGKLHLDCRFIEDVYIPYVKNPYGLIKALQKVRQPYAHAAPATPAPAPAAEQQVQPVSQTLIQISGNNPVYIVDKVPNDPRLPLQQLPKMLGDNMKSAFQRKA